MAIFYSIGNQVQHDALHICLIVYKLFARSKIKDEVCLDFRNRQYNALQCMRKYLLKIYFLKREVNVLIDLNNFRKVIHCFIKSVDRGLNHFYDLLLLIFGGGLIQ